MTISPHYSSTAPTGWNQLPLEAKEKFYNIASKGDWSAHEAYDHLVPDHLKDNPEEVMTWMDGGTVTVETDVYHQGRGGVQTEEIEIEISDRDVSRIEAGGDYSPENTIMEDMSVNRSRGGVDMTASELEAAEAANATDAELIEQAYESGTELISAPIEALTESTSLVGDIGEAVVDGFLPVLASIKAAEHVSKQFKDNNDKVGFGAMAAGVAAAVMVSPVGAPIATAYGIYALTKFTFKMLDRMANA